MGWGGSRLPLLHVNKARVFVCYASLGFRRPSWASLALLHDTWLGPAGLWSSFSALSDGWCRLTAGELSPVLVGLSKWSLSRDELGFLTAWWLQGQASLAEESRVQVVSSPVSGVT